ncbi:MAG: hypothetical protein C4332_06110 [Meiothermus sp.]
MAGSKTFWATRVLFIFTIVYPLFLFPGALFSKPTSLFDAQSQTVEMYQQLPKVVILLVAGLLGLLTFKPKTRNNPFLWLLLAHLVLVLAGCLNSRDEITFSILGPDRRMDGLLYQTGLVLFTLFVYEVVRRKPDAIRTLFLGLFWSGLIQSILVLLQRFDLDVIGRLVSWNAFQAPVGSIGQPGMLAGLLLVSLLTGLWLYTMESNRQYQWLLLAGIMLVAAATGMTTNRSVLLGLGIGLVGLNLNQRSWKILIVSCLSMLALFGANVGLNRFEQRKYADPTTGTSRILFWKLALGNLLGIPGQPMIGGGPDAFRLSILRNPQVDKLLPIYRLEYGWPSNTKVAKAEITQERNAPLRSNSLTVTFDYYKTQKSLTLDYPLTLDKTHNMLLDRLLDYGGFSVLVWLLLYLFPTWRGFHNPNALHSGVSWISLGIFIYYLTWFPVIQVEPLHLLVVAVGWALFTKEPVASNNLVQSPKAKTA